MRERERGTDLRKGKQSDTITATCKYNIILWYTVRVSVRCSTAAEAAVIELICGGSTQPSNVLIINNNALIMGRK